jgi:capsular polysaccharide biosynthesis protein
LNGGTPPWGLAFARRLFPPLDDRSARPRLIFVEREPGDVRGVLNASDVRRALEARGFVAVTMANRSFEEQAAVFAAAEVIVGLHGAALANLVFARPGTHVIELIGANTLNWIFPPLSWAAGLEHDILVGTEPTPPPPFWTWQKDGDQIVDVVRLSQLVDTAIARVDARR